MPLTVETLEMEARMHDRSDEQLEKIEERLAQTATRGEVIELRKEINGSFGELRSEIAEMRSEMVGGLAEMRSSFDRRFEKVDDRFERLIHALLAGAIAIAVALIGVIGALLVS